MCQSCSGFRMKEQTKLQCDRSFELSNWPKKTSFAPMGARPLSKSLEFGAHRASRMTGCPRVHCCLNTAKRRRSAALH